MIVKDKQEVFDHFEKLELASDPKFKENVLKLKGKTLGCFCKPNPCHGDVIVEYLENTSK